MSDAVTEPGVLSADERRAADTLIDLALAEDLGSVGDLTSATLIPAESTGMVQIVARHDGVLAGLPLAAMVFARVDAGIVVSPHVSDGARLCRGDVVADVSGPVRGLLTGERTMLNFITHLSGIATLTRQYVDEVAGTRAVLLDTRKTLPGYRLLQKYAVRCGGGTNHRLGLYDAVLIKDNHLAAWTSDRRHTLASAINTARQQVPAGVTVEVEVDSLDQLRAVLPADPDIVLLDNMDLPELRTAIAIRDERSPGVRLEASGGVTLETVRSIAETGVDRISCGAITHSAVALDLAFDWSAAATQS
ncbi:MAG: carboxylating nicotinate-nucleotide diphosphorylase [Planctomycetaceae bacterium]|nr:carboxylating nicotinate-nucleotide diphosphorylase [Planctomycetaceae bacterium]